METSDLHIALETATCTWLVRKLILTPAYNSSKTLIENQRWFKRIEGQRNSLGGSKQDEAIGGLVAFASHLLTLGLAFPWYVGNQQPWALHLFNIGVWNEIFYEAEDIVKILRNLPPYANKPFFYKLIAFTHHMAVPAIVHMAISSASRPPPAWAFELMASGTILMGYSALQYVFDAQSVKGRRQMLFSTVLTGLVFLSMRWRSDQLMQKDFAMSHSMDTRILRAAMGIFNVMASIFCLKKIRRVLRQGVLS